MKLNENRNKGTNKILRYKHKRLVKDKTAAISEGIFVLSYCDRTIAPRKLIN